MGDDGELNVTWSCLTKFQLFPAAEMRRNVRREEWDIEIMQIANPIPSVAI